MYEFNPLRTIWESFSSFLIVVLLTAAAALTLALLFYGTYSLWPEQRKLRKREEEVFIQAIRSEGGEIELIDVISYISRVMQRGKLSMGVVLAIEDRLLNKKKIEVSIRLDGRFYKLLNPAAEV